MKSANIEASSHMHSACRHLHISFTPASLQFHTGIEEHSLPKSQLGTGGKCSGLPASAKREQRTVACKMYTSDGFG